MTNNSQQALQKYRTDRARACKALVLEAIAFYAQCEGRITYKAVARKAGVNISYFRNHPELKTKIAELIASRKDKPTRYKVLQERITALEKDLKRLQNKYDKMRSQYLKSSDRDLIEANEKLTELNQELLNQNKHLQAQLNQRDDFIMSGGMRDEKRFNVLRRDRERTENTLN